MLKTLLFGAFIFFCSKPGFAETHSYKIKNIFYRVKFEKGVAASPSCFEKGCEALTKAKTLKNVKLVIGPGGKNPLSRLCQENLNAELVVGTSLQGKEESFCHFSDKSVISCASLREFIK